MKRFPAKVKGSRLDPGERRHGHRGALDSYGLFTAPWVSEQELRPTSGEHSPKLLS